jgi:hypothetical protein
MCGACFGARQNSGIYASTILKIELKTGSYGLGTGIAPYMVTGKPSPAPARLF